MPNDKHAERMRELMQEALEALKLQMRDTFMQSEARRRD